MHSSSGQRAGSTANGSGLTAGKIDINIVSLYPERGRPIIHIIYLDFNGEFLLKMFEICLIPYEKKNNKLMLDIIRTVKVFLP